MTRRFCDRKERKRILARAKTNVMIAKMNAITSAYWFKYLEDTWFIKVETI